MDVQGGRDDVGIVRSVLTGFNGTAMPGYAGQPDIERRVWDLAAYVWTLQRPLPVPLSTPATDTSSAGGYWTLPVPTQGAQISATATFSDPGEYMLRVQANDESGEGGGGFQCCWTNAYVKVTVQ